MEEKKELWFCPSCNQFPPFVDMMVDETGKGSGATTADLMFVSSVHCATCQAEVVRKDASEPDAD